MARIRVSDRRWRSRVEIGLRNSKAPAVVAMQLHLGVERLLEESGEYSNCLKVVRFGGGKCEDAAVFGEEHIVLREIEAEASDWERPVAEAAQRKDASVPGPKLVAPWCESHE
jgi:hypothetical protein